MTRPTVPWTLLILLSLLKPTSSDDCSSLLSTAKSLGYVNGKCFAVTTASYAGKSTAYCNAIGSSGVKYTMSSIDSMAENEKVKEGLEQNNMVSAYIGLWNTDSGWVWANSNPSVYANWENAPITIPPTVPVTTAPIRSTLPPAQQRRSTAIVVAVDASLYSTNALTFAQVDFIRSLSHYIGDRGPAEFAFFAYGCTQITPYTSQYPTFVNTFETTDQMIANLNETINHDCVRSDPLDFKTMFRDQTIYYNRYSSSVRPFKSSYISMIYFSASTNTSNIKATSALYPMVQSSVITINVGDSSADLSALSIPAGKNGLRVKTADDILGLVPKIDAIIFGNGVTASGAAVFGHEDYQFHNYEASESDTSIDATVTPTDCAYMNSTDGLWYSDGDGSCTNKKPILCQYFPPTPEPPPTENPSKVWQDPCYSDSTNFTYFEVLANAKCYRMSTNKKQFAEAENICLSDHPLFLHTPRLTSVQTQQEEDMIRTLIKPIPNEGMFWIGLKRDPSNSSSWIFVNGDPYDDFAHNSWRDGYPRDADGCDCVALVVNDSTWVNTDCNKSLYSICAFSFNSTDKAF